MVALCVCVCPLLSMCLAPSVWGRPGCLIYETYWCPCRALSIGSSKAMPCPMGRAHLRLATSTCARTCANTRSCARAHTRTDSHTHRYKSAHVFVTLHAHRRRSPSQCPQHLHAKTRAVPGAWRPQMRWPCCGRSRLLRHALRCAGWLLRCVCLTQSRQAWWPYPPCCRCGCTLSGHLQDWRCWQPCPARLPALSQCRAADSWMLPHTSLFVCTPCVCIVLLLERNPNGAACLHRHKGVRTQHAPFPLSNAALTSSSTHLHSGCAHLNSHALE